MGLLGAALIFNFAIHVGVKEFVLDDLTGETELDGETSSDSATGDFTPEKEIGVRYDDSDELQRIIDDYREMEENSYNSLREGEYGDPIDRY